MTRLDAKRRWATELGCPIEWARAKPAVGGGWHVECYPRFATEFRDHRPTERGLGYRYYEEK